MEYNNNRSVFIAISFLFLVIGVIGVGMWGMPKYRVYSQTLRGEADLREQEWTKKIQIEQAKASNESATLQAEARIKLETAKSEAEIIRAKGVAEANRIIADSLKGNEAYLRYLWIDQIGNNENVIYVPTEANLPILEARNK